MANVNITIDGKQLSVPAGMTILAAAKANDIYIPTLCFLEKLEPHASCRMCVVEVEGARTFQHACAAKVKEGMVVHTNTEAVRKSRKLTLQLLLSDHSVDCHHCLRIGSSKCKYLDQAASIICLTLGKAMGSGGLAMNWAVLMTSPVYKSALPTVQPDAKKYPILSKLPKFRDWCLADAAFDEVLAHPEGAIIGMADVDHMIEKHVVHKDKKMHLWCKEIEDYLKEYITPEAEREALALKDGNNLYLSSGYRYEAGVNNAMRNPGVNRFRKVWSLLMNPEDAKQFGFADGETIRLSTNRGSIEIPVEYSWRASRGYCLMPHHFGNHYQGKKLYMNANFLTDRKAIDKLTGNSEWRQTPCRVEKL